MINNKVLTGVQSEEILMGKILNSARDLDYAKYTSTLMEGWKTSIAGLSEALFKIIDESGPVPENKMPKHRSRAVSLAMSLGFMKYYYQAYTDLINESDFSPDEKKLFSRFSGFILCDEAILEANKGSITF